MDLKKTLKLAPNIRWEKAEATTGYIWGKPAADSNILRMLPDEWRSQLDLSPSDIVAERWLCTDDRGFPSLVINLEQKIGLDQLIEEFGPEVVGPQHLAQFGPYLGTIMKQLDTNTNPTTGSLSVQLHPQPGHPTRPSKPEMWQGLGSVYLGWNQAMTPEKMQQAIQNNQLEKYMNLIELTPEKLVLVTGGLIHAIRYNSFLAEWSMAPGQDDIKKGNIKDATVSPYDRTDGKTPRPGKEDLAGSIEVMTNANTFGPSVASQLLTKPQTIVQNQNLTHLALFRTPIVFVDEYHLTGSCNFSLQDHGKPLFVKQGSVEILNQGKVIDHVLTGEERYLPHALEEVTLTAVDAKFNTWYAPFDQEKKDQL